MDAPDALDTDDWLGQARALRRLATGLVRDPHEAEDLLQETWIRARDGSRSRPWLRTVLRNLVRDRARARARRSGTERAAAREEALPSPDEIVGRLEVARRLAQEVAGLTEPYRTAIHLRFFEELAPEAIAERTGVPLETVRTRLRRGLAELRTRMDRAHGGERGAWSVALLRLAGGKEGLKAANPVLAGAATGAEGLLAGTLGVTAVLLTLGAVGWFVRTRSVGERRAVEPPAIALGSLEGPSVPATSISAAGELGAREVRAPGTAARNERTPQAGDTQSRDSRTCTVEGRVVIEDEVGNALEAESGVLTIGSGTTQADGIVREVVFDEGRWSTTIHAGDWLVVGRLLARGREALLPEPSRIVPGDEPLVVRGRWLPRGRLRVVDARTGQELDGIEVRCAQGWPAIPEWTHPGDHERVQTVVADGASPVLLPERFWTTPYWVHAAGHTWDRIDFDHRVGGERTLALSGEPSALRVTVLGELPIQGGAHVRLYDENTEPQTSWRARASVRAAEGTATVLEDLLPGRYLAAVELGEAGECRRLGASEVELLPHATAGVTIRVDASVLDVSRTHLHGTLRLPPGVEREVAVLQVKRLEGEEAAFSQGLREMSPSAEDESLLRWDAGQRRTGTYLVSLMPLQHREVVEASHAGGETVVALEVPPLVTVRVEVLDAASGAPLVPERLSWSDGDLPGVLENTNCPMGLHLPDGAFQFVAPGGPVEVWATAPGYEEAGQELVLDGAPQTCRLEMRRATAIHFALRDGEASVPIDHAYASRVRLTREGRPLTTLRIRTARGTGTLLLEGAGHYTLTFPPLGGFRPIEPRTVAVNEGETIELVVSVERAP